MKQSLSRLAALLLLVALVSATVSLSAGQVQAAHATRRGAAVEMRLTHEASLPLPAETLHPQPEPVRTPSAEDRAFRPHLGTPTPPSKSVPEPVPVPVPELVR